MTESEFRVHLGAGRLVYALTHAPFGYTSSFRDGRYTFRIDDGRTGVSTILDEAVSIALRATPAPTPGETDE